MCCPTSTIQHEINPLKKSELSHYKKLFVRYVLSPPVPLSVSPKCQSKHDFRTFPFVQWYRIWAWSAWIGANSRSRDASNQSGFSEDSWAKVISGCSSRGKAVQCEKGGEGKKEEKSKFRYFPSDSDTFRRRLISSITWRFCVKRVHWQCVRHILCIPMSSTYPYFLCWHETAGPCFLPLMCTNRLHRGSDITHPIQKHSGDVSHFR